MKRLAFLLAFVTGVASAQTTAPVEALPSGGQGELIQQILLIFTNTWAFLQSVFSTRLIGVQLACIAVSMVIAWMVASPIKLR